MSRCRFAFSKRSFPGHALRLALTGAGLVGMAASAGAQSVHELRLMPAGPRDGVLIRAYFRYEAAPGSRIEDGVEVRNQGTEALEVRLSAADARTASRGGIAIASGSGASPHQAGDWLHLDENVLRLDAGADRLVPFSIEIPPDILPGEYAALVVARRTAPSGRATAGGPVGVRFEPRSGVSVLVTVPGRQRPELQIERLAAVPGMKQQGVFVDLVNRGNAGAPSAEGRLVVREVTGGTVADVPISFGYLLARDSLRARLGLGRHDLDGWYDATLELDYALGRVSRSARIRFDSQAALPVVRAHRETDSVSEVLPRWLLPVVASAVGLILLLLAVVFWQSRKLARPTAR